MSQVAKQTPPVKNKFKKSFKAAIIAGAIAAYLVYRVVQNPSKTQCLSDTYMEATHSLNRLINQSAADVVLGIGQLTMDIWTIFLLFYWLINIRNMRAPTVYAVFFLIRGSVFLEIAEFPFPKDIVWHNPGFPSLAVPYDRTRDFFYSGHTGTLMILTLEMWKLRHKYLTAVAIVSLLFITNLLVIVRIHYTTDIIGGLIYASFFHRLISKYSYYCDKFFSLPFVLMSWLASLLKNADAIIPAPKNNILTSSSGSSKQEEIISSRLVEEGDFRSESNEKIGKDCQPGKHEMIKL